MGTSMEEQTWIATISDPRNQGCSRSCGSGKLLWLFNFHQDSIQEDGVPAKNQLDFNSLTSKVAQCKNDAELLVAGIQSRLF